METVMQCNIKNKRRNIFITNTAGNSIPLVLLIALIVMIIGGAVAYGTVQVFSAVKGEAHSQRAYFAAESALERSMCCLDTHITKESYATSKGIIYSGDDDAFITAIIGSLNSNDPGNNIYRAFNDISVYTNDSMNKPEVTIAYSYKGGIKKLGLKKIVIPITITATARMENGLFKSYGKKSVATREYEVWIDNGFKLNGAVYTLGDLLAKTTIPNPSESEIEGNIYVFGTGLENARVMQQHYNGGVCVTDKAVLKVTDGNIYTRNLVRAGLFSEGDSSESCAIVVDKDIVAQGIQVFGSNDSIVVNRDAYTFDDVELIGVNSYIAINGNYYGLNPGEGKRHDTSSAIINAAPRFTNGEYSRIVVNGDVFVNGTTFRIKDTSTGEVGHKMEDVSHAWIDDETVYAAKGIAAGDDIDVYKQAIEDARSNNTINGFSVILQNSWIYNGNITNWEAWITEIKAAAINGRTNINLSVPSKVSGFCNYAMAANDRIYMMDRTDRNSSEIKRPTSFSNNIGDDDHGIAALKDYFSNDYVNDHWTNDDSGWTVYASENGSNSMTEAMTNMMGILQEHVEVFAKKEYVPTPTPEPTPPPPTPTPTPTPDKIKYSFVESGGTTLFMKLSNYLDGIDDSTTNYFLKIPNNADVSPVNVISEIGSSTNYHIILNLNPNRELHIDVEMYGIIFSHGKVVIKENGKVNGAVIAAGRGYDSVTKVGGSAAEYYIDPSDGAKKPRLPKVIIDPIVGNSDTFKNWDYAALVFENGGSILFSNREALLEDIKTSTGIDLINVF
jgi:hypothetical protein